LGSGRVANTGIDANLGHPFDYRTVLVGFFREIQPNRVCNIGLGFLRRDMEDTYVGSFQGGSLVDTSLSDRRESWHQKEQNQDNGCVPHEIA
jgi:hypothetical protein